MSRITEIKDSLLQTLQNNMGDWDWIYGVAMMVCIAVIVILLFKKVSRMIAGLFLFLIFTEIGNAVAFVLPDGWFASIMRTVFKYDVLTALAQLCSGTKLCEWLLYARAFFVNIAENMVNIFRSQQIIPVSYNTKLWRSC